MILLGQSGYARDPDPLRLMRLAPSKAQRRGFLAQRGPCEGFGSEVSIWKETSTGSSRKGSSVPNRSIRSSDRRGSGRCGPRWIAPWFFDRLKSVSLFAHLSGSQISSPRNLGLDLRRSIRSNPRMDGWHRRVLRTDGRLLSNRDGKENRSPSTHGMDLGESRWISTPLFSYLSPFRTWAGTDGVCLCLSRGSSSRFLSFFFFFIPPSALPSGAPSFPPHLCFGSFGWWVPLSCPLDGMGMKIFFFLSLSQSDRWIPSQISSPSKGGVERGRWRDSFLSIVRPIPFLRGGGKVHPPQDGGGGCGTEMKTTRQRHWCVGSYDDRGGRRTRASWNHQPAEAMAQFATRVRTTTTTTHVGGRSMRRGTHGKHRATERYAAHTAALSQAPHTQTNHTNGNGTTSMPSSREALKKIQAQAGTNRTCHAIEPWNRKT